MDLLIPHLDLMPVLRAMGHRGGLKAVEKHVGLETPLADDVNGGMAVDLWAAFREQGDMPSLPQLLDYNIEDARPLNIS